MTEIDTMIFQTPKILGIWAIFVQITAINVCVLCDMNIVKSTNLQSLKRTRSRALEIINR